MKYLLTFILFVSLFWPVAAVGQTAPADVLIAASPQFTVTINWTQTSDATVAWLYQCQPQLACKAVGSVQARRGQRVGLLDGYGPLGTRYVLYEYRATAEGYQALGQYDLGEVTAARVVRRVYLPVVIR